MKIDTIKLPAFFVAGLSVRTINKDGRSAMDIGQLWQRFTGEKLAEKLYERECGELYCVYTGYESDHNDYYTVILGCKVSSIASLPDGFTGKAISASTYNVYTGEGEFPASVANTWQCIWATETHRLYSADFDVYDIAGKSFEQIKSKVYVAVD